MCSWPHVLRRPYTNTKHWFFGVKPSTRLEQCSTRAEPPIEHFRLVGLWWEQPSGLFPTAVCLESPSKPGPVPSNGGAHFFLWIEWTTLSPPPLSLSLYSPTDTPTEGSRNSWVELNGIYSCIGYGHGPGILHPRHTQPLAHMSSGIDCGWSSPHTVDRM